MSSVSPLKGTIYNLNDALEDQPHLWLWRERNDQLATEPKRRLDAAHTFWTIADDTEGAKLGLEDGSLDTEGAKLGLDDG